VTGETGMDFQDRVGIITGGASGIGRAVAAGWAARGGMAIVADYDAERGAQAAADLVSEGGRATFVECDLRDGDSIINVVETVSRASSAGSTSCTTTGSPAGTDRMRHPFWMA